jgi:hypothetical protein
MPVTLTTFGPGAVIDASLMRAKLQQVETYVNEGIITTDRADSWMKPNHVYRPDFYGLPNMHTTMPSGESYFRSRPVAEERRAFFSYYLGGGPYPVPGINATVQIPEDLRVSVSIKYRLVCAASFYVYEFGGADGYMDESTSQACTFDFYINGESARSSSMVRKLYKGSRTATVQNVAFYPRKQVSLVWGDTSDPVPAVGINNVGIVVNPIDPGAGEEWKHIVFVQSGLVCRYFLR